MKSLRQFHLHAALSLVLIGLAGCSPEDTNDSTPGAPGNLQATAQTANSVTLSWTTAYTPANGGGVTGYSLESKTGSGTYSVVASPRYDATTYTVTGLTPNTTYTFRLRAANAFGTGPYSSEVSATTSAAQASLATH